MSTNLPDDGGSLPEWISQSDAARIHGVSRQAIHKLVRNGRLRSLRVGGHLLVHRGDVEAFSPQSAGRPPVGSQKDFERIKSLLDGCEPAVREQVFRYLTSSRRPHPIETRLGTSVEVILAALERSADLTVRMFRGVIAEAAFEIEVVRKSPGLVSEAVEGNPSHDFLLNDGNGPVRVQIKLQRSVRGRPLLMSGYHVVETQRTRGGVDRATGQRTRPYRFGEFDILAVCMQPSTGAWDQFRYTVARWLRPDRDEPALIATLQPVAPSPNDDWTDDPRVCLAWFREQGVKTIRGSLGRSKGRRTEPPSP